MYFLFIKGAIRMNKQTKKHRNIVIIFVLLFSLFFTGHSFAAVDDSINIVGDPKDPKLTIFKYENGNFKVNQHGGFKENIEGRPIENVEFTLIQTHLLNEETDAWEEINDGITLKGTTNQEGKVEFTKRDGLQLGRYEIKETAAPDYVVKYEDSYSVDLPMTAEEGTSLNYDVYIYAKNEIALGNVVLEKVNDQGKALSGVQFSLFKEDGDKPFEDNIFSTDSSGQIMIENLPKGKYYFTETQTIDGYISNNKKIFFELVNKDGVTEVKWQPVEDFVNEKGQVVNYKAPEIEKDVEDKDHYFINRDEEYVYNITIKTPADIGRYKTLGVTDRLDDRLHFINDGSIPEGWKVSGTYKDNVAFSQEGQTLIWSIKDLSELRPNETIKITFTAKIKPDVELDDEESGIPNQASLDFDNDRGEFSDPENPPTTPPVIVTPTEGSLKIIKVDKDDRDRRLKGAVFKVTTDKEGKNVVQTNNLNIKVDGKLMSGGLEQLVTEEDGEILIENLPPNTYYLHETKAPTYRDREGDIQNYTLLTKPLKFTIESSLENKEIIIENSKSKWFIPRTGGLGTILFTAVGIVFIIAALIVFIHRRRENLEKHLTA